MEPNILNVACLGKIVSIGKKQETHFIKKLSSTEAELKKSVAYKERVYCN